MKKGEGFFKKNPFFEEKARKKIKRQGWQQGASLAASQAVLAIGCRELAASCCELVAREARPRDQLLQAGRKGGKAS